MHRKCAVAEPYRGFGQRPREHVALRVAAAEAIGLAAQR